MQRLQPSIGVCLHALGVEVAVVVREEPALYGVRIRSCEHALNFV